MDLTAYTLQKLNREKRERQPNWTESEKQLLLSLTRMHQSILENKGSDTMTIKRKSEAWDEIALRMNAAGYYRSKERLKQQLGRIRAAEAKKIKDAIERNLSAEHANNFQILSDNHSGEDNPVKSLYTSRNENNDQIQTSFSNSSTSTLTMSRQEEGIYIKIEETPITNEEESREEDLTTTQNYQLKPNIIGTQISNTNAASSIMDNMHFTVQSVQSLAKLNAQEIKDQAEDKFAKLPNITNTISPPSTSAVASKTVFTRNNEKKLYDDHEKDNNSAPAAYAEVKSRETYQQKSRRLRRIRFNGIRNTLTREQRLRQLHLYRIAVERERLRSLKLQQKRDRILYRKDVEIQNLKLQILRNLTNQNRDANRINL
ncbi:hypothetical protein DOY81_006534 [Sarcophaga bullata]|nr:hypothetical protein DOY81_006534 [Sarcophaga bullata]